MRKYDVNEKRQLLDIRCNKCGKKMKLKNGIVSEGAFSIAYGWGYFSEKDGQNHIFDLCEICYDELIKSFLIPIEIEERNEIV